MTVLDAQQVLALAPDASSAAAARKLAVPTQWKDLGRDATAMWGRHRGSALYEVRVDLRDLTSECSCPSRKSPCKHVLALMLLGAEEPARVSEQPQPAWVSEWCASRTRALARREARLQAPNKAPDPVAQARREGAREARVDKGVEAFDAFLRDLIRTGLAGLESRPGTFEAQAARLVDAQASGLASRVRRLEYAVGGDPGWPDSLLDRMGKLALLARAWLRRDEIEGPLRDDVRLAIGFNLDQAEVLARGERVRDAWGVVAQALTDDDRLRSQRSWLRGARTGRTALVLQFAAGSAQFPQTIVSGTVIEAELVYWPGAAPQRALIEARHGTEAAWSAVPGFVSIAEALSGVADRLAQNPWGDRTLLTLAGVVPMRHDDRFWLRDAAGAALRITTRARPPWDLLALSAGAPVDVAGEWNGERLLPLSVIDAGAHHGLNEDSD